MTEQTVQEIQPIELYALAYPTDLHPGDLVFYENSRQYVIKRSGRAPGSIRLSAIQADWPYLSTVHVIDHDQLIPACLQVLVPSGDAYSPPDHHDYDREQGINGIERAQIAYENRTP